MYLLINVKRISVARFNFSLNFPCFCEPESPPSPIIWQCTLSLFIFYCADRSSEAGNSTREMESLFNNFFSFTLKLINDFLSFQGKQT